jgi:uncharacterized protein (UPF0210 family)
VICEDLEATENIKNTNDPSTTTNTATAFRYLGIDTSLNPSLDDDVVVDQGRNSGCYDGSVAGAMEELIEIDTFGGPGTIAAAAAITTVLQSFLPPLLLTVGYCGLMLPVCEDHRLAQLASLSTKDHDDTDHDDDSTGRRRRRLQQQLRIVDLLAISSVCGVGVDTVPLAGNVSKDRVTSLILDVVGLAARWDKSLSCRVLPFRGKQPGDRTDFDSPYMVNTNVFDL